MSDNELIAEFMGVPVINDNPQQVIRNYHNCWDYLMRVIEKIDTLDWLKGCQYSVIISSHQCVIKDDHEEEVISNSQWQKEGDTRLTFSYKAVVEFIKWHNTQKQ